MNFERDKYYSLTDIQKKFKISRSKLQVLLDEYNPPVVENTISTYYTITAKYYLIEDIEKIIK